ncbi:MAG: hypothetical protein WA901_14565, partial [Phormidesmis sp.]
MTPISFADSSFADSSFADPSFADPSFVDSSSVHSSLAPAPFSQLIGQTQAVELLQRVIELQRVAPGSLFVGPEGTGKSVAVKGFAQLVLLASP